MRRRTRIALAIALAAGATAGGLVAHAGSRLESHLPARRRTISVSTLRTARAQPLVLATRRLSIQELRVAGPRNVKSSDRRRVARAFLVDWLGCIDHQRPCTQIAGALPAYARALARQSSGSLPTPAEAVGRPTVLSMRIARSCGRSATATGVYQDGPDGQLQLHLSLIHAPTGWKVFDVAEAAPHIALPIQLNHGPGRC